jgi:hypothetical protein
MLARYRKLIVTGGLLLGMLLCLMIARYQQMNSCFKDRAPLRSFMVTLDRSQQKQLIEQSRKFAEKYGFKFQIEYYTLNHENFLIDLTRKDIEIIASNPGFDLGTYFIGFYNYDCIHPAVASDVDGLVSDLKSSINEIPSVTITDER